MVADRARILAIHGGGVTPALWDPVRAAAPELELHTPDLNRLALHLPRGDAPYDALVDAIVRAAPAGPLVLAGATIGGRFALSAALRLGDAVRAIFLLTPTTPDEAPAFLAMLGGLRRVALEYNDEQQIAAQAQAMIHRWGPRFSQAVRELAGQMREAARIGGAFSRACEDFGEPPIRWIHRIAAPIEIRFGAADPMIVPEYVDAWRGVPGVRSLEVWPGVAHQIALEAPERVAADLRRLAVAD